MTGPIHTEAVCPRVAADSCTNHLQPPPITTQSPFKWSSNHLPITSLHRRRPLTDRCSRTSRTCLLNEFRPQEIPVYCFHRGLWFRIMFSFSHLCVLPVELAADLKFPSDKHSLKYIFTSYNTTAMRFRAMCISISFVVSRVETLAAPANSTGKLKMK